MAVTMYKALYNFKGSYASALSFREGEVFLELPGAKSDKNWYFVLTAEGRSGFVPRNYVTQITISGHEKLRQINLMKSNLISNSDVLNTEKKEILSKLEDLRSQMSDAGEDDGIDSVRGDGENGDHSLLVTSVGPMSLEKMKKATGSKDSLTSIRSSKKRAAPQPPVRKPQERSNSDCSEMSSLSPRGSPRPPSSLDLNTTADSIPEERETKSSLNLPGKFEPVKVSRQPSCCSSMSTDSNVNDVVTVTYQQPQESCRQKAQDLVELVRSQADISHTASVSLLRNVLSSLHGSQKDLNVLVPSLLNELSSQQLFSSQSDVVRSQDYLHLISILEQLTKAKEDEQQRNWMLYEDEDVILRNLEKLSTTLRNANQEISVCALRRFKYCHVQNLVEYFQMETRWSIRRILMECFLLMCSVDQQIISLMLSSVLPLELAQVMFENCNDVDRMKLSAVILTVIFSQGEPMPVHYVDQLGERFVSFLLDKIEHPPAADREEVIADAFMALVASYNLQFQDPATNIVMVSLGKATTAKIFTEKLLLLFNREEDPAAVIGERSGMNSIHKLILDVFSSDDCIVHFYTNDLLVLIDIIARQLTDLGPGEERYTYLELAHAVLTRSSYEEHLHRLSDLQHCMQRIKAEEGASVDKTKVSEICSSFSCFKI